MSELENARAQAEAKNEPTTRALRSARRAQLWAGLNRYLASEAAHAHKAAEKEREPSTTGTSRPERKREHDDVDADKESDRGPARQGQE